MFDSLIIEESLKDHPKVQQLLKRFAHLPQLYCTTYGEVFNRKAQNFRLQKENPSLILAKKFDGFVLKTPSGYGIGGTDNFYFSHMLNCIYDCRYCFLQGMYRSANYLLFVNFEDSEKGIEEEVRNCKGSSPYFFSGYDGDSLAMESITGFGDHFLTFFEKFPEAFLELRTKSHSIQVLLKKEPLPNVVVAFSLNPKEIAKALEHKAPTLAQRVNAIKKLQAKGWQIGLRFDPIIYCENFYAIYGNFFEELFNEISLESIHSVSLGVMRFPKSLYKNIFSFYPDEMLFGAALEEKENLISYKKEIEDKLLSFCQEKILKYLPSEKFFPCGSS